MDMNAENKIMDRFAEILSQPLKSVEILPGDTADWIPYNPGKDNSSSHSSSEFPFLYCDGNLGIPKKVLYGLYMVAISRFTTPQTTHDIYQASCVLLLTNPAHQSALNARKRLVQGCYLHPIQELTFTEVLIKGSSEGAKQGILWNHRRWLFELIYPHIRTPPVKPSYNSSRKWCSARDLQTFPHIPTDDIKKEFEIVRSACEMYPRNYHAWSHWHFVVDASYTILTTFKDHAQYFDALVDEFMTLRRWVDLHVSDHTAIHNLCNLSQIFCDLDGTFPLPFVSELAGLYSPSSFLADHALALTISYPTHESLWMYLRRVVYILLPQERINLIDSLRSSSVHQSAMAERFFSWFEAQEPKFSVDSA